MHMGARSTPFALVPGMLIVFAIAGCGGGGARSSVARHPPLPRPEREAPAPRSRVPAKPRRIARPCGAEDLVVSHEGLADGALSNYYTRFTVFNLSEHACSISGFPKLLALGTDRRPIEGPARHVTGAPEGPEGPVNIASRDADSFRASWSADVFPPGACRPGIVERYRVVLPGAHLVQTVPYPSFERCTGAAARGTLSVGRIEPLPEPVGRPPGPPGLEEAKPAERLPRCAASDLLVWTGLHYAGGAAAGTSYGHLEVANLSERPCELSGVPHMVAVDLRGRPVGPPVGRSDSMPTVDGRAPIRVARIGAHESALFTFSVGEVLNYGTHGCDYEYAAGFDVTLPGSSRAQYVPAPVRRCLHSVAPNGPQVSVGPIE